MKAPNAILSSLFAAMAAFCHADEPPTGTNPPPVSATASWGAGLSIAQPVGLLFTPAAYSPNWKFRGAFGGTRLATTNGCSRAFMIDLSGNTGENIADGGSLRFNGLATFAGTSDGALSVDWEIVADRDAELPEAMVEAKIPIGRVAGGFRIDDRIVQIPPSVPSQPHLFRGPVSFIEVLDADGAPWLRIDLPDTAKILVQDNRPWGNPVISLRLFFVQKAVEKGVGYPLRARFSVPDHKIQIEESGPVVMEAGPDWIPVVAPPAGEDWIEPGSALDLSATMPHHEPAGKFGRVVAVGDHFELEGRPGEEIRFCGVNLVHGANTPSTPEDAERFAANLARMGFNSVRIHHHERPIVRRGDPAVLAFNTNALDRFDALVAACVRHGLYITTDLFVSRAPIAWRAVGIDRDGTMRSDDYKRLVVFHEGAYSNLVAWTRLFLGHVNPYTGRSLAEEPALATLAIVNEGNVGNWGRDKLLATPGVVGCWQAWRAAGAANDGALRANDDGAPRQMTNTLQGADLPADLYASSGEKKALSDAFALFLADSETRFFHRMAALVRDELGCRAPLSSLSSWYNPAAYSLARTAFDYNDDHGYVDHPFFLGQSWRLPSTHAGSNPLLGGSGVPAFAWRRLFGKPFCVTEWNWAAPGEFRAVSGLVMGALAARQGWAGMWRFAWSHDRQGVDAPGSVRMRYFDLHADPTLCASERATLCLFLRGDLAPLSTNTATPIEVDEAALRRGEDAARRLAPPPDAPSGWECRIGVRLGNGKALAEAPAEAPGEPSSATGRAMPDSKRGAFVVETPRTAGGFAPSGALDCGTVRFEIAGRDGPVPQDCSATNNSSLFTLHSSLRVAERDGPAPQDSAVATAVWASSLDGKPLAESSRILVSHVTDSRNTGARFDDQSCRIWLDYGTTPALMRRGRACVELAFDTSKLRAGKAGNDGAAVAANDGAAVAANDGAAVAANDGAAVAANDDGAPRQMTKSSQCAVSPAVFRLSLTGRRIAEIPSVYDPATGKLSFIVDTAYDPTAATLYYEIVR